jgi:L-ascorbate metabolism protein UlaG (beta-lactamase superfamily)
LSLLNRELAFLVKKIKTMKQLAIAILLSMSLAGHAQEIVQTDNGPVKLTPIQHATMVLEWNGLTIYVDPYGGAERFENLKDADYILITDIHGDHLNNSTLAALDTKNSTLIVPKAVADKLTNIESKEVKVINNGEVLTEPLFSVTAIPMYNLPESEEARHTKGRGNGYILNLGGKNLYISGDTEAIPEMRALKNIDIAFVCMNLPYTMDINQAAEGVLAFKPKTVIPYHHRGQDGLADTEQFKSLVNSEDDNIKVLLLNWYE